MKAQDYAAVSEAMDEQVLRRALTLFSEKLGFGMISTMYVDGDIYSSSVKVAAVGNVPKEFLDSHADLQATRQDPVIRRLARGPMMPFAYDQKLYVDAGAGHLWEEMAPFGYRCGVATSLAIGAGKAIWIGVDRPEPLPTSEDLMTRIMADLQLLAIHAHAAAVRVLNSPLPGLADLGLPNLTEREMQVLLWTAQGKTSWEVGAVLGLKEKTVNFHLANVTRKLGVRSKHQAVLKCLAAGVLPPRVLACGEGRSNCKFE